MGISWNMQIYSEIFLFQLWFDESIVLLCVAFVLLCFAFLSLIESLMEASFRGDKAHLLIV